MNNVSINNWYRLAKEKKPYKLVKIINGEELPFNDLGNKPVYAYSENQAKYMFLKKYPVLKEIIDDYLQMNIYIKAKFDKKLWEEKQAIKRSEEEIQKTKMENLWYMQD